MVKSIAFILACAMLAANARGQTTQPAASQPAAHESTAIDWSTIPDKERDQLLHVLDSPAWPIRVFALLRMERYGGAGAAAVVRARFSDKSWQVRCFALRQCKRMEIPINAADLAGESDPRVIRTALRLGVALPEKQVKAQTIALLQKKAPEDILLELEIAAACAVEPIRADAAKRIERLIRSMSDLEASLFSRRLAVVLNLSTVPENAAQWRLWLQTQHETVKLAPAGRGLETTLVRKAPLVSEFDEETFARLLDYMGSLQQRDLDLVIVMDCTSSMLPMVNQARAGVDSLILFLRDISREMRLAFVGYRDHDNQPVWDGHPFTTDVNEIRDYLFKVRITGGADLPEAVFEGLQACSELKWNAKATRQIVLVGDAPPHPEDVYKVQALMDSYRDHGLTVHSVHVPMELPARRLESMSGPKAEEERHELAEYNKSTAQSFADIATAGGGRTTELGQANDLVPEIMHFTIEDGWWNVFDEFYEMYLALCR